MTHKISYKIGSKRKNDIIYSVADIKKLKNSIKWRPKYFSLNKICKSSLKWYLNNNWKMTKTLTIIIGLRSTISESQKKYQKFYCNILGFFKISKENNEN